VRRRGGRYSIDFFKVATAFRGEKVRPFEVVKTLSNLWVKAAQIKAFWGDFASSEAKVETTS